MKLVEWITNDGFCDVCFGELTMNKTKQKLKTKKLNSENKAEDGSNEKYKR